MFWHSILSWLVLCEIALVSVYVCFFFVRFFNVCLEVRPSLESLIRWRGPFLCSVVVVVVVVVDTCIGTVVAVPVVLFLNRYQ